MTTSVTPQRPAIAGTPLETAAPGLDLCVHCGFCLQACPTYLVLDDENDSPRGRLMLMRGAVEGEIPFDDPALTTHIDRCLGCRACETACPSGVPYGHLLEATRATIAIKRPLGFVERSLLATMASPLLRALLFGTARIARSLRLTSILSRLPGRAGFAFAMLESTQPSLASRERPTVPAQPRGSVATLDGCVMDSLFSHTNQATRRVLSASRGESDETERRSEPSRLVSPASWRSRRRSSAWEPIATVCALAKDGIIAATRLAFHIVVEKKRASILAGAVRAIVITNQRRKTSRQPDAVGLGDRVEENYVCAV